MKEYAHDKLFSSAAFENSPLRTYSQSQVGLSPRDRANSFHDIREREEAGAARREAAPTPRTYSDFMRNLAAKYNTETSPE